MLVQRQPRLLEDAPPQDLPRIFVGNLTEQILDSSLHQLLSRFGTISNFARSKCSTFAHLSLEIDEASATKCISSLNHVKWFGTSLRVEKARQHYLNRLSEEWKQRSFESQSIASETINEEQKSTRKVPFHNMPKGKHIHFSFPDDSVCEPPGPSSSQITNQLEEPIKRTIRVKSSASASKQSSLQTTLSLFGLSATQDENRLKQAKRSLQELPSSGRGCKRPRSVPDQNGDYSGSIQTSHGNDVNYGKNPISQDTSLDSKGKVSCLEGRESKVDINESYSIEHAEAVEDDPSKIDIERERSSYLHVFRSMFVDQGHQLEKSEARNGARGDMPQESLFTRYRRAALYTTLQTPGMDTLPLQTATRTGSNSKSETTSDSRKGIVRAPHQGTDLTASYRQAALYKKLQFVQGTDAV